MLSINLLADFLHTGHVTGLLLLASESLVVVLTLLRRRAQLVDRSAVAAVVTTVVDRGPAAAARRRARSRRWPICVTAMISALGLALVVVGKITLGRSFGLVPANRGVVVRGPYTFVRHPIYTGYLVTHVAFLVAHPVPVERRRDRSSPTRRSSCAR